MDAFGVNATLESRTADPAVCVEPATFARMQRMGRHDPREA